jgi:hypothetical protein
MRKYALLVALAIPPWAASELGAPRWGITLALAPFLLFALSLDNAEEEQPGNASRNLRRGLLLVLVAFGLAFWGLLHVLWQARVPRT